MIGKKKKRRRRNIRIRACVTATELSTLKKRSHNRCYVCKWKPGINVRTGKKHNSLALDHWHKLANVKVKTVKLKNGLWKAFNVEFHKYSIHLPEAAFTFKSHNRKKAKKQVTQMLKRKSVRGLLCWACNTALQKFKDNAKVLIKAGKYLLHYERTVRKGTHECIV